MCETDSAATISGAVCRHFLRVRHNQVAISSRFRQIARSQERDQLLPTLPQKYRPQRFQDVVGQDRAVRFLSNLIRRGKIGHPFILFGAVGSGKTTLARLYAKALNCQHPDAEGSPCGSCERCQAFERSCDSDFHQIGPADFEGAKEFKQLVEHRSMPPMFGEWRVVFIDEAHALKTGAFDALLEWVEDPPERVVYCFATTEIKSIPPALRSRLALLEIRPLDAASAIDFLRRIAEKEDIDCEPGALKLLAGLAEGQPRDLLARLDQLRHLHLRPPFKVTRDDVRAVFGVDDTRKLVDYFSALAEGDMGKQTELMLGWNEDPPKKLKLVQLFLLALYYNELLRLDVIVDPVIASIKEDERRPIVDAFRSRIESKGIELNVFWREMIAFWPVVPDRSEASLMLRFALFHQFVSEIDAQLPSNNSELSIGAASLLHVPPGDTLKRKRPEPQRRRPKIQPDPAYLDYDQVKNIVNTASFCVQAYGVLFNVRMTLWHRAFKRDDAASAADLMSDFVKELGYRVGYRLLGRSGLPLQLAGAR